MWENASSRFSSSLLQEEFLEQVLPIALVDAVLEEEEERKTNHFP